MATFSSASLAYNDLHICFHNPFDITPCVLQSSSASLLYIFSSTNTVICPFIKVCFAVLNCYILKHKGLKLISSVCKASCNVCRNHHDHLLLRVHLIEELPAKVLNICPIVRIVNINSTMAARRALSRSAISLMLLLILLPFYRWNMVLEEGLSSFTDIDCFNDKIRICFH